MRIEPAAPGRLEAEADSGRRLLELAREFEALLTAKALESLSETVAGTETEPEGSTLGGLVWIELARELTRMRSLGIAEQAYAQWGRSDGAAPPSSSPPGEPPTRSGPSLPSLGRPVTGVLSSPFGDRRDPIDGTRRRHLGVDIAAPEGTPVAAAAAGRVRRSGWQDGYGWTVVVEHAGGLTTRYAHLRSVAVEQGAWVEPGDRLGEVGRSGRATGPHLHFEVRREGRAVDPEAWTG